MLHVKTSFEWQAKLCIASDLCLRFGKRVMHAQSQKHAASRLDTVQVLLFTGRSAKQKKPCNSADGST